MNAETAQVRVAEARRVFARQVAAWKEVAKTGTAREELEALSLVGAAGAFLRATLSELDLFLAARGA